MVPIESCEVAVAAAVAAVAFVAATAAAAVAAVAFVAATAAASSDCQPASCMRGFNQKNLWDRRTVGNLRPRLKYFR